MQEIQVHSAFGLIQIVKLHWSASSQLKAEAAGTVCVLNGWTWICDVLSFSPRFVYLRFACYNFIHILTYHRDTQKKPLRLMQN